MAACRMSTMAARRMIFSCGMQHEDVRQSPSHPKTLVDG
jgi:hypothetical protein